MKQFYSEYVSFKLKDNNPSTIEKLYPSLFRADTKIMFLNIDEI